MSELCSVPRVSESFAQSNALDEDIARLTFVSGKREEALRRLGIRTVGDPVSYTHLDVYKRQDLYGASVSLAFTRWLRPSRVFDSLDELIATVEGNIEDIRHNLGEQGVSIRD